MVSMMSKLLENTLSTCLFSEFELENDGNGGGVLQDHAIYTFTHTKFISSSSVYCSDICLLGYVIGRISAAYVVVARFNC